MSDRELLELAAKAVGKNGRWVENFGSGDYYYQGNTDGVYVELKSGGYEIWNPLTDDGDALRLAVKLGLLIYSNESEKMTTVKNVKYKDFTHQDHCSDAYAATRLAIVRAAAEIGRNM